MLSGFRGCLLAFFFFHTCQVRVVRFYQSCSALVVLLLLLLVLLLLLLLRQALRQALRQLFAKLFANVQAQCASLDLNLGPAQLSVLDLNLGPAQLSVHRWTSTWDFPTSVCTAGPQPGTCPAQTQ